MSATVRTAIGETPLLLKVSTFPDEESMNGFLCAVSKPADGVTLVNGISRPVLHRDGRPAFGED